MQDLLEGLLRLFLTQDLFQGLLDLCLRRLGGRFGLGLWLGLGSLLGL